MTAPHVLIVNIYFAPYTYGGATVVAEEVARQLRNVHGYRVTAISAMSRTEFPAYAILKTEQDGIVNYLINLPFGRPYAEVYNNSHVTEVVDGLLQQLQPDVMHVHSIQDIGAGIISAVKRRGTPVILSTHDFWWICERQFMIRMDGDYCTQDPVNVEECRGCVDNLSKYRTRQSTLKAHAAQADLITFPSQFAHDLNIRSGLTAARARVWTNGVKLPKPDFFARQSARRAARQRLVFGFVGGPSQIKGWPIIRKAFAQLKTDQNFDVLVVDGSLDGSWWKGADFSRLAGNWTVVPRFSQDEIDDFYARIDVLLFMSQWKETFGLTIREALVRGIRIIQTNSGGTTEHALADPAHMLEIGDGARRLVPELLHALKHADDQPDPVPVTSFADQAAELDGWIRELLVNA